MKKRGKIAKAFIAPASVIKRLLAYAVDLLIINFIIIFPFRSLFARIVPSDSYAKTYEYIQQNPGVMTLLMIASALLGLLMVMYFTIFEYKLQQTPGKMLMKQYIVPAAGRLSFWNYFISNLTFVPFFPFILLWVIDPIHMIVSPKNQRFMEKLTGILVVERYEA